MKETLVSTLLLLAVPALVGLGFSGVLALLGVWRRANAAAKQSAYVTASAQLETGVEGAIHALQGDIQPLAAQLAAGKLTLAQFGIQLLPMLKKDGQAYLVPAIAEALGTTVTGLEQIALGVAAHKLGLSPVAPPSPK